MILKLYKSPGLKCGHYIKKLKSVNNIINEVENLETEFCYYIESKNPLKNEEINLLKWILSSPIEKEELSETSVFDSKSREATILIEIGPRLNFSTPFSSNAVSICKSVHLLTVTRIEVSTRYLINCRKAVDKLTEEKIVDALHDQMTECRYLKPIETFDHGFRPGKWFEVDVLKYGRSALEDVNTKLGLAFDNWDLEFYTELFQSKLKRNPTSVECFDLAQSNSEHSRHWFFKGRLIIDGEEKNESLLDMIIETQTTSNSNNVIKFSDNSSAIEGYDIITLCPEKTDAPSSFFLKKLKQHLIFTAETHNFPTGVAPFSGATTGTGGRLRDIQGIGRGGNFIAGTAGYSVGNLHIPEYELPWEECDSYPSNLASPVEIIVEASNGASDYGNKFGEPVISGFARTFGMKNVGGERREWIKPIMFSGGMGSMDSSMTKKLSPEKGMKVVKIGGPVYRIGVGGGSASSVEVQGDNESDLDFGAVQRGDAEMEQKLNRVIRACVEIGEKNPILSIHDQGAGGNANVLQEIVEPAGAVIFTKNFELGDPSLSTLELWGAEYQENDAILCKSEDAELLKQIAEREKCPINFVGTVTGNGRIILSEEETCDESKYLSGSFESVQHPVDLDLELVLGKMPRKTFNLERKQQKLNPCLLPQDLSIKAALDRVLRLPSVASKRYLTNKVDRCVTGLIAQQQCVGPLHTPLADVAVTALSHFSLVGVASAIGEQPVKGLVNSAAGARMSVAESLTNLVFAPISNLKDVKCSGNWMWAAKLPGEGAALYDACLAMCTLMKELGIAIDGGKDSLSMAARNGKEVVKAPGTLVISSYAPCPDITKVVTPDLKLPSLKKKGNIIFVDLSNGKNRIGGSALAQVFMQLGNEAPDVDNAADLKNAFNVTQSLLKDRKILSGHDLSDGGLITCILEMCFAGISGVNINITHKLGSPIEILFSEELGWLLEVEKDDTDYVLATFKNFDVNAFLIGESADYGLHSKITIVVNGQTVLNETVHDLMKIWEETSYKLECRQTNEDCALQEFSELKSRRAPEYKTSFNPDFTFNLENPMEHKIKVAVIREEGINGDREMAASLLQAGFEVWDVTMQDLLQNHVTLDSFRGIIFPGGFSYADVLGSAKGWAASLLFNPKLQEQLKMFRQREDTFSFGVCNGCQLMCLLGFIDESEEGKSGIFLDQNKSERFECRWSTVKIEKSTSIMLKDMEDTQFGIWVAHGEGRFTFRDDEILNKLEKNSCLPIKYVDEEGKPTERYPLNPNGSIGGIAAVCSPDGRHLAMMPHPERCTLSWQLPWVPSDWDCKYSPWHKLFVNAYEWCTFQESTV